MDAQPIPDLNITISERPASSFVSRESYDDKGLPCGPNPDYEAECRELDGKLRLLLTAAANIKEERDGRTVLVPSQLRVMSGVYSHPEARKHQIYSALRSIAESFVKNVVT